MADGWWYSAPLSDDRLVVAHMSDADLVRAGRLRDPQVWSARLRRTRHVSVRVGDAVLAAPLVVRPAFYELERRWPQSEFWERPQGRPGSRPLAGAAGYAPPRPEPNPPMIVVEAYPCTRAGSADVATPACRLRVVSNAAQTTEPTA